MLFLTSLALLGSWSVGVSCPAAFTTLNTTVGAISSSNMLSVCVSKAQLVSGSNGSLTLVLGGGTSTAPRCLIYPIGLSPDLTFSLLQSGHLGCWSLYPPGQPITIVNVGVPPATKIQSVLKQYRPDTPRILLYSKPPFVKGSIVSLRSSAAPKTYYSRLLELPVQIRFKPTTYLWQIAPTGEKFRSAKLDWRASTNGSVRVGLTVTYSAEYVFPGLTDWRRVLPDINMNAQPLTLQIDLVPSPPKQVPKLPRLVSGPCLSGSQDWGC